MVLFYSCLQVLRSNMCSLSHPSFFSLLIHSSLCSQLVIEPRSLPFRTHLILVLLLRHFTFISLPFHFLSWFQISFISIKPHATQDRGKQRKLCDSQSTNFWPLSSFSFSFTHKCERRKLNLFHTKNSKHFDILKNSLFILIILDLFLFFPYFFITGCKCKYLISLRYLRILNSSWGLKYLHTTGTQSFFITLLQNGGVNYS